MRSPVGYGGTRNEPMDDRTLSKADREIMISRGWDVENAESVTKYQDLRQKVEAKRIPEQELNRQMNNFEMQQYIDGNKREQQQEIARKLEIER